MSKSDESQYSRINLTDDKDDIRNKIKKAKTDSHNIMGLEALDDNGDFKAEVAIKRPEAANLINIFCELEKKSKKEILEIYAGKNFSNFKENLTDSLITNIIPIGNVMKRMIKDSLYLKTILKNGAELANEDSQKNLLEIKKIIGFN